MTAPDPNTPAPAAEPATPSAPAAPAAEVTTPTPDKPEFAAITSQEAFDKAIGKRLADERAKFADYDQIKKDAEAFRTAEDAKKDELTKATEELDKLRAQVAASEAKELRREVAEKAGIPLKWATRLQGKTREELEADAAELAETLPKPEAKKPPTKQPEREPHGGGAPQKDDPAGFDPAKIAAKLALRA